MSSSNNIEFTEIFDNLFVIAHEMIKNHGEDNYYCAHSKKSAIISVYDGCGGLGSQTYESFQNHTSAYMASRIVSGAVHDWYHDQYRHKWSNVKEFVESLSGYIQKGYAICSARAQSNMRIRGSMIRDFPTTAAIAFTQFDSGGVSLFVVWAGDSRLYLIDQQGLAQLSKDDIDGEDALSNLSNDGVLTNLLSSDGKYVLNAKCLRITKPTVIFAATDGCFGYIPTPMEFEYLLLSALVNANTPENFRRNLNHHIGEYAGDDYALGMMGMYFGSFGNMKNFFRDRVKVLEREYIMPLRGERNVSANDLWKKYRVNYERYL